MPSGPMTLWDRYIKVRSETEALAAPIRAEDAQVQSMDDVSPTKWHLGHTTWFFETFLLEGFEGRRTVHDDYRVLFNSYYNTVGRQHPRPKRGLITRPSLDEVVDYRHEVDADVRRFLESADEDEIARKSGVLVVGLHHEQQHQELMMTDILHVFASSPMRPAYSDSRPAPSAPPRALRWHPYPEGIVWIGYEGPGFSFDNEHPRHRSFVHAFELASRPVTAGEYMEFMSSGAYERHELWLSDGWSMIQREGIRAPLYWERRSGTWWQMSLYGMRPVDPHAPVSHVSYYEADAFARWCGARLPTEEEWEVAAGPLPVQGNLQESEALCPRADDEASTNTNPNAPSQMYGDVWEWTQSAYLPYHGYRTSEGALGEYNGKFMCGQMVLRGGSFVTPVDHIRAAYRNFFYPHQRWQFNGIRLARDAE